MTAAVLLAAPPTPGRAGALRDALRYLLGSNILGQILLTLLFPLPLALSAATHAGVLWLTSNAAAACTAPVRAVERGWRGCGGPRCKVQAWRKERRLA